MIMCFPSKQREISGVLISPLQKPQVGFSFFSQLCLRKRLGFLICLPRCGARKGGTDGAWKLSAIKHQTEVILFITTTPFYNDSPPPPPAFTPGISVTCITCDHTIQFTYYVHSLLSAYLLSITNSMRVGLFSVLLYILFILYLPVLGYWFISKTKNHD